MKLSRGKSSVWLWCCIALIALGVLLIFSVSGTVVFRSRPVIIPPTPLDCVNGEEDAADDCDLGADFDADFELHPEIIVRNSFCDGVNCHIIQSTLLFDQCCSERGLPRPHALSVSQQIFFKGVNLAGGEKEGDDARRGEFVPFANNAALFIWKGMNTFRIPIVWEYFADIRGNILTASNYVARLDRLIAKLIARDVVIILELHNYMRYNPSNITLDRLHTDPTANDVIGFCHSNINCTGDPSGNAFILLWISIVNRYNDFHIVYELMNEPHDVPFNLLRRLFFVTIENIRFIEKRKNFTSHIILISGNQWSNLSSWFESIGIENRSNAVNIVEFTPFLNQSFDNNLVLTINQYFDADLTGTYKDEECMATNLFIPQFDANWARFKNWSITNNVTSFVGSFGVPDTPTCRANLVHFLDALEGFAFSFNKSYGIIGWTAWAAGRGLADDARSLAPGGRANQLIWDPTVYGRYLIPLNVIVEPLENVTRAMQITNNLNRPLHFLDGYLPFQFRGNASIAPGATGYLYSNNEETTPTYRLQIKYFVDTKDNQLVFGFTTPSNSNTKIAYSVHTEATFFHIINFSVGCPIQATGPNTTRGEPRCFRVNLNSDTSHDIVRG